MSTLDRTHKTTPGDLSLMPPITNAFVSPTAPTPKGPYNHAVATGDLLFIGAQIGMHPDTDQLDLSVADQTRQTLANLETVAHDGGGKLSDAVRLTIYLADLADLAEFNGAYAEYFGGRLPARSTLQAAALVGGARVCIDAIVALA